MGIELVAIAEGFDMTNPYGRAMAQMASVFSELERAMIRERTRAAVCDVRATTRLRTEMQNIRSCALR
jgi:DNA invertase Pin-like site-specific DNA recombinase